MLHSSIKDSLCYCSLADFSHRFLQALAIRLYAIIGPACNAFSLLPSLYRSFLLQKAQYGPVLRGTIKPIRYIYNLLAWPHSLSVQDKYKNV